MKITGATSLLELHNFLWKEDIKLTLDFVISAGAWRASVGRKHGTKMWIGLGRDISEAIANAYCAYDTETETST